MTIAGLVLTIVAVAALLAGEREVAWAGLAVGIALLAIAAVRALREREPAPIDDGRTYAAGEPLRPVGAAAEGDRIAGIGGRDGRAGGDIGARTVDAGGNPTGAP